MNVLKNITFVLLFFNNVNIYGTDFQACQHIYNIIRAVMDVDTVERGFLNTSNIDKKKTVG